MDGADVGSSDRVFQTRGPATVKSSLLKTLLPTVESMTGGTKKLLLSNVQRVRLPLGGSNFRCNFSPFVDHRSISCYISILRETLQFASPILIDDILLYCEDICDKLQHRNRPTRGQRWA